MGRADREVMAQKIMEGEARVLAEKTRKRKEKMKKKRISFFADFKKFITRGNVVDMAVGVIVGGAFTAIVNGMSNFILKPITNWILALIIGEDALTAQYTYLKTVYTIDEAGEFVLDEFGNKIPDLAQSIYIDWGSFINAVINFFLVALVLFIIVRFINKVRENNQENMEKIAKGKFTKEQKAELKANGIKPSNKAAAKAYFDDKAKKAAEEAAKAEAEAAAKAAADRLANPTTEDLLKEIIVLLKKD